MSLYGYKISGFAHSERYFEAEALLDRKLKGFEKDNAAFEEDGSRRQRYFRKNEDGSETEVLLTKNVTESGIMVFSDIPLKYLQKGGLVFYIRDIIPTLIIAAIYWGSYYYIMRQRWAGGGLNKLLQIAFVCGIIFTVVSRIAIRVLNKNRSPLRVRFMALGSIFGVFQLLYFLSKIFAYWTPLQILYALLRTPVPPLLLALAVELILHKFTDRRQE